MGKFVKADSALTVSCRELQDQSQDAKTRGLLPRSGEFELSDSRDEAFPRARGGLSWLGSGGASLVLLVTAFFVLYPLVLLVYGSFVVPRPGGGSGFGIGAWLSAWNQAGMLPSVVNTVTRTVATEVFPCRWR